MEINPRKGPDFIRPSSQKKGTHPPTKAAEDSPRTQYISSDLSSLIEDNLSKLPEIRTEKIEEGMKLAEDSTYPMARDLDDLSQLIAGDPAGADEDAEEG